MTAIEIAARALATLRSGKDDYDTLTPALRDALINEVRTVLHSLREPGDRVAAAGAEVIRNVHPGESPHAFRSDAANTWRFMIDAILSEG